MALAALGIAGAYSKSLPKPQEEQGTVPFYSINGWSDPSNEAVNPLLFSNKKCSDFGEFLGEEVGPFGVPRRYYRGTGNSLTVCYGSNYDKY